MKMGLKGIRWEKTSSEYMDIDLGYDQNEEGNKMLLFSIIQWKHYELEPMLLIHKEGIGKVKKCKTYKDAIAECIKYINK